jgi:hypothetical protein
MAKQFECEGEGAVIRDADDDEVAARVERHIAEAHPGLIGMVSREDIRDAAKEA